MLYIVLDSCVLLGTLERGMYMFLISLPFKKLSKILSHNFMHNLIT